MLLGKMKGPSLDLSISSATLAHCFWSPARARESSSLALLNNDTQRLCFKPHTPASALYHTPMLHLFPDPDGAGIPLVMFLMSLVARSNRGASEARFMIGDRRQLINLVDSDIDASLRPIFVSSSTLRVPLRPWYGRTRGQSHGRFPQRNPTA
jgi:hypothetical protein